MNNPDPKTNDRNAGAQSSESPPPSPVSDIDHDVKADTSNKQPDSQTENSQNQSPRKWTWEKITVICGVIVNFGMLFIMHSQLGEMKIAGKQTDKIIEMSRIDQRAWVGVDGVACYRFEKGKPFPVSVVIKNTGKTPALKCIVKPYMDYDAPDLNIETFIKSDDFVTKSKIVANDLGNDAMFPNTDRHTIPMQLPLIPTDFMVNNIMKNIDCIYVFGNITYDDIFGAIHSTTFCYVYDPTSASFKVYHQYNSAN
jgi:hypothetical protein